MKLVKLEAKSKCKVNYKKFVLFHSETYNPKRCLLPEKQHLCTYVVMNIWPPLAKSRCPLDKVVRPSHPVCTSHTWNMACRGEAGCGLNLFLCSTSLEWIKKIEPEILLRKTYFPLIIQMTFKCNHIIYWKRKLLTINTVFLLLFSVLVFFNFSKQHITSTPILNLACL